MERTYTYIIFYREGRRLWTSYFEICKQNISNQKITNSFSLNWKTLWTINNDIKVRENKDSEMFCPNASLAEVQPSMDRESQEVLHTTLHIHRFANISRVVTHSLFQVICIIFVKLRMTVGGGDKEWVIVNLQMKFIFSIQVSKENWSRIWVNWMEMKQRRNKSWLEKATLSFIQGV